MNIETVRRVLLWCTVINYAILVVWFLAFMLAHDSLYHLHASWFIFPGSSLTCFTTRGFRFTSWALSC